jgi:hypothetical protein
MRRAEKASHVLTQLLHFYCVPNPFLHCMFDVLAKCHVGSCGVRKCEPYLKRLHISKGIEFSRMERMFR